jgi:stage V sporulation protein SpoVS
VYELVRYVEQSNPHLVDGLLAALLKDGMTMTALGASVAAVAIKRLSDRRGWRPESSIKR